jgi:hypothetical protein
MDILILHHYHSCIDFLLYVEVDFNISIIDRVIKIM